MPLALVALGSNLGDPVASLRYAYSELVRMGEVVLASGIYRSTPVGGPSGQADYLNAVLGFRPPPARESPRSILELLLDIERRQGRIRRIRWEARTLDLDLLAVDNLVVSAEGLTVPHPLMMERSFVLAPLCEIAPEWTHPVTAENACTALARVGSTGVERTDLAWEAG